jgi:uncharacterized protein involved in propanediol utilization
MGGDHMQDRSRLATAAPRQLALHGHLGELLQGRLGHEGPVALLTLPCPTLLMHGFWRPGRFDLHQPGRQILTRAQAAGLLRALALPVTGQFTLRTEMPLGGGAGSSTAALVAIARLAGYRAPRNLRQAALAAHALAAAALAIEGATDPLMFARPARLLWASREARCLAILPPLPAFDVLGGFCGPTLRTDPADGRFPDIADLADALPLAMRSAKSLAEISSESARRSLVSRALGPDPTEDLAKDLGALGYAIGHTGPARALLFAPGAMPSGARSALLEAGFRQLTQFRP